MPLKDVTEKMAQPRRSKKGGGARHVYETLRDEILELKLTPGLPIDETGLAERFSMSRSPIREALVRLSADGLVHVLSNRSTVVAPLEIADLPRYVEALDYVQRAVTRMAARNRRDEDLARMKHTADAYEIQCESGDRLSMSQANKEFHLAIAEGGHNSYLTGIYSRLLDEGRRILHLHYAQSLSSNDPFPLSPEHYEMIEAIKRKDELTSDRLAHQHTRLFHQRLLDSLDAQYLESLEE